MEATEDTPLVKAAFGAVSGVVAVVANSAGGVVPVWAVVHPAGNAGAVTPSKFSENKLFVTVVPVGIV